MAVVDAIANIFPRNAASVVTGELCVRVTRSEQTSHFIAVVPAVIIMVTAVVVRHASPVSTSEHSGLAGVEGCQSEARRDQSAGQQNEVKRNRSCYV